MTGPTIASVMTAEPISIGAATLLSDAQKMMIDRHLRHLPVMEGERILGVVSDRDVYLAQIANLGLADYNTLQIGDVCTLDAYAVPSDRPLAEVVTEMAKRHIGSVLIVDEGKLRGIFTATDACRQLGALLDSQA